MNLFYFTKQAPARLFAALALFSLVAGLLPMQAFATALPTSPYGTNPVKKVDICHSTPTAYDNGIKEVSVSAVFSTHAGDITGGADGNGDIIPPFYYEAGNGQNTTIEFYPGKNWYSQTIAIWNNSCEVPPVDVCSNIEGNQATVPQGYYADGTQCFPNPVDLCLNIDGVQTTIPEGYVANGDNCDLIPPPVDLCSNIEGNQATVPQGYYADGTQCFPNPVDLCPNIAEVQVTVPQGLIVDNDGNCVEPPVDVCDNLEGLQTTVPEGYVANGDNCDTETVDMCPNIADVQETVPQGLIVDNDGNCVEPPVDVCDNLEGLQTTVPEGYVANGDNCDLIPPPVCPVGTYGLYPSCYPVLQCPEGQIGTYPICYVPPPTPSCQDGIQNQDETDVDIGGVCGGGGGNEVTTCTVTIVSDTSATVVEKSAFAKALTFIHDAWDAVIPGATWIWGDDPVVDPTATSTQTFQNQFGFVGNVTNATLYVASDNGHSAVINGSAPMVGGSSFDTAVSYDVDSLINESGNNELDIAVTNIGVNGADATTNPAGVMYKLVIEGEVTSDADCATPYVPPRDDEDELSCEITVNDNSIQEGGDVTLTWSSIGAAFANLDGDSVAANDSLVVEDVDEDTTFTLTVYDEQENSAECSVSVDTRSGGGGGGGGGGNRAGDRDGRVLGDSDSIEPEPLVLGEQVSAVPAGAPDAGAGGTSSRSLEFFQVAPVALVGRTRKHG